MVLLLQLNAELPDRFPGHERRLYVFACKRKACRRKDGSIRAIRGVRISPDFGKRSQEPAQAKENTAQKAASQGLGEALFGVKPATTSATTPRANPFMTSSAAAANPFAATPSSPAAAAAANPFAQPQATPAAASGGGPENPAVAAATPAAASDLPRTFAETLSLNNAQAVHGPPRPPEPWPEEAAQPAPYPVRWLADAEYETLDPTPLPAVPSTTRGTLDMEAEGGEGSGGGRGGKEDKEVFESSMDATFQKFADRVGQNPEQCIRYEFAGQPLLYSKADAVGKMLHPGSGGAEKVKVGSAAGAGAMPRCGNCGAGRVFEVQLMPRTIQELEVDEDGLDGMDWGTIIVGVCERDCQERSARVGESGYLEEWVGVQWEELTMKR